MEGSCAGGGTTEQEVGCGERLEARGDAFTTLGERPESLGDCEAATELLREGRPSLTVSCVDSEGNKSFIRSSRGSGGTTVYIFSSVSQTRLGLGFGFCMILG